MEIQLFDASRSSVNIEYHAVRGSGLPNFSVAGKMNTYWPDLAAYMTSLQKGVSIRDANNKFDKDCMTSFRVTPGAKPIAVPPLTLDIVLPTHRVVNKQFKKRKARGEVIMAPYSCGTVHVERSVGHAAVDFSKTPIGGRYEGYLIDNKLIQRTGCAPPVPPPGYTVTTFSAYLVWTWWNIPDTGLYFSPDCSGVAFSLAPPPDTALVTAVTADCNNGAFDLLTELVELPETLAFAGDLFKKAVFLTCDIEEEVRIARKSMPLARFTKWFSDHWLKGRYALLPIFYSLMDIEKVLKQMGMEYAEYKQRRQLPTPFPGTLPLGTVCSDTPDTEHRCFIKSRYTPDSLISDFRRLININLLSSAWELTTLSFVADWAFNIGDFISAMSGGDGNIDSQCAYICRNQATYEVSYASRDPALTSLKTSVKFNAYDRSIINPIDHVGLTIDVSMNWKRAIDAFALSSRPAIARLRALTRP